MRTTIDLKADVLESVMKETGAKSRKKAVEQALTEYIRMRHLQSLAGMIGNHDSFDLTLDDLEKMRNE